MVSPIPPLFIIALCVTVAIVAFNRYQKAKTEELEEIRLFNFWLTEKMKDPTMTLKEWEELLPLCRFADKQIARTIHPFYRRPVDTYEGVILRMMHFLRKHSEDTPD